MDRIELEKRLIGFSSSIIAFCKDCRFDDLTYHLAKQIVRSGSSAEIKSGVDRHIPKIHQHID